MSRESDLLQLIAVAYEAAQNPSLWPEFLKGYARAVNAAVTAIQQHRFDQRSSNIIAVFGMTPRFKTSYHEHYARVNVWRDHGRHLYQPGRVILDHESCPRELLTKSEFYNDYLLPQTIGFSVAGVIAREAQTGLVLTALRSTRQTEWTERDRTAIHLVLPHVTRAWEMHHRLQLLSAGTAVLDDLDIGVLFVRVPARLVYANRVAETILADADGLAVRDGMLCAYDSTTDARLRQAIRDAVGPRAALTCAGAIAMERRTLRRPYQVTVGPLAHNVPALNGLPLPHAMVLIVDPERRRAVSLHALARLYGLTPREAALASLLSTGAALDAAARELRMTYETARSHLRRVFEKTGTSRQAELIVLVSRLPSRRRDDRQS